MYKTLFILLLGAVSVSITNCSKTEDITSATTIQDSTRNAFGILNPVTITVKSLYYNIGFTIWADSQMVNPMLGDSTFDSVSTGYDELYSFRKYIVPNGSKLYVVWSYNGTSGIADTIASKGLVWLVGP